eukprot:scaffold263010_cov43-Prasinocladus_malaysianus.AAC.1
MLGQVEAHPDPRARKLTSAVLILHKGAGRQLEDLVGPFAHQQLLLNLEAESKGLEGSCEGNLKGISLGIDLVAVEEGYLAPHYLVMYSLHTTDEAKRLKGAHMCM